jgi:hypothetical protein
LAFSIHELSQILGKENTRIDLVPIFNNFLKDLDEVRNTEALFMYAIAGNDG